MNEVRIIDKSFSVMISEDEINAQIDSLAEQLNSDYAGKDPLIISILNGSFLFTADLVRKLNWDPEVQFMRLSSYGGAMKSSGEVRVLLDLNVPVRGRDILIVEDIVDTGRTMEWLRRYLASKDVASAKLVTLLFKETAFEATIPPEYVGFPIPNAFVVGYGMDYQEHGRSLGAIYQLKD